MNVDEADPGRQSVSTLTTPRGSTRGPRTRVRGRLALLLLGGASMLLGLSAALLLLGLPAPITTERLREVHGPLMIVGFLGTLIALERSIALRQAWAYGAPSPRASERCCWSRRCPWRWDSRSSASGWRSWSPSTPLSGAAPRRPRWRSSGSARSSPYARDCCGSRRSRPAPSSPSLPGSSC